MDRDEQVGAFLAGDFGAPAQRNEVVTGTGQFGAEAFHAIDLPLQFTGNGQHHVFFTLTTGTRGPRVFTAVAGIDDHDDVALAGRRWRQLHRWIYRGDRDRGDGRDVGRRRNRRSVRWVVEQVDHQAVAILGVRRQGETLRRDGFFQVDDHPQVGRRALSRAHGGDRGVGGGDVQWRAKAGAVDVDDQSIRGGQGEHAVLHRPAEVEHQARVVRRPPQTNTVDLRVGHSVDGHRQKQHPNGSYHRAKAHT
ncbi:hypothetical protein D3C73_916740 [compost metagenome]